MPDYCLCKGDDCTQRDKCFRYRAISDPFRQSYFAETPGQGDECEHFMTVEGWPDRMLKPPETRSQQVIDAINFLVADTSVPRHEKVESLLEVQEHIDFLSDALDKDV